MGGGVGRGDKKQNPVGGVSSTGQQISQLLAGWRAVHWSNRVPPEFRAVPSHLADADMNVEEARDVPWGLGSADWGSSDGRAVTHLFLVWFTGVGCTYGVCWVYGEGHAIRRMMA